MTTIDYKKVKCPKTWQDELKEELDEIKERLAKLENKVLGENQ